VQNRSCGGEGVVGDDASRRGEDRRKECRREYVVYILYTRI
jgi:hypothetical protein